MIPRPIQAGLPRFRAAFSLLEMLVVIGIIGALLSILIPGLTSARRQAYRTVCSSNIRQLNIANELYAQSSQGRYCPGMAERRKNLHRWHGSRKRVNDPFDPASGPLASFLGADALIRECPAFPAEEIARSSGGFERGAGGFGYNSSYIGTESRYFPTGEAVIVNDRLGVLRDRVARPAETLMFADTAFAANTLIEYSFIEPRFHPQYPTARPDPSIHFRHAGKANAAWCDGHIDAHERTFTWSSGFYPADPARWNIGWFGERDDNSLFDLN
ncbi:MAG: prepilin-type N-terminal cleavage/methylation domain-containing protein [Phycisphaerae bacterium]|nr:prepilin-type N-terminal cleavage/methylation domain-containing protein [Phycisphaerae bacterium]